MTRTSTRVGSTPPTGLNLAILQYPQEFGLEFERQFGDFVEKDGAAAGCDKETPFVVIGAGKSALDMAKEFAFEERADQGAAVDRHEWFAHASAFVVQCPRDQFFAGAALARDQHRGVRAGHFGDHCAQGTHAGRLPDEVGQFAAQVGVFHRAERLRPRPGCTPCAIRRA